MDHIVRTLLTQHKTQLAFHLSQGLQDIDFFKQIQKIFDQMAINVQRIACTYDKLYFLYRSV